MIQTTIKELLQQEAQAVLNIPVTDAYEKSGVADCGASA